MKSIGTVIIDDEPKAIELLENYIERTPFLMNLASFRNPFDGIEFLQSREGCLIFLDINMPKLSGISLAKVIGSSSHIIFTTAYSEYAVESYELNAVDYLLKPITFERFIKAVSKIEHDKIENILVEPIFPLNQAVSVKSGSEVHRILTNEILFLVKDHVYITYQLTAKKILARESIQEALQKLGQRFIQVHKSYIVNIDRIEKVKGDRLFILSWASPIPIGKAFKKEVLSIF